MGAGIMLIGNAVFSYILGQFLQIVDAWKEADEDIGDGD